MEILIQVTDNLRKLVGLHRQLLEIVRSEREALAQADLQALEKATGIKTQLIESVQQLESERLKNIGKWSVQYHKAPESFTLQNLILAYQGSHPKESNQLRSLYQTLNVLIQRITEQNKHNSSVLERSLGHINEMKINVLKEAEPAANTYTSRGQRASGVSSARNPRLISTEV